MCVPWPHPWPIKGDYYGGEGLFSQGQVKAWRPAALNALVNCLTGPDTAFHIREGQRVVMGGVGATAQMPCATIRPVTH